MQKVLKSYFQTFKLDVETLTTNTMVRAPESADYPVLALVDDPDAETEPQSTGTDDAAPLRQKNREKANAVVENLPLGGYNYLSPMN